MTRSNRNTFAVAEPERLIMISSQKPEEKKKLAIIVLANTGNW